MNRPVPRSGVPINGATGHSRTLGSGTAPVFEYPVPPPGGEVDCPRIVPDSIAVVETNNDRVGSIGEIALLLAASPFSGVNMYASAVSWVMAQMRWFSSPLVSSLKSRRRPSYVQPKSKSGRADLVNRLAEPKSSTGATHRLPSVGGRGRKVRDRRNLVARWGVREGQKSTRQGKPRRGEE